MTSDRQMEMGGLGGTTELLRGSERGRDQGIQGIKVLDYDREGKGSSILERTTGGVERRANGWLRSGYQDITARRINRYLVLGGSRLARGAAIMQECRNARILYVRCL